MKTLQDTINEYLTFCQKHKRLDEKTLKAYSIDLKQFATKYSSNIFCDISMHILEEYIVYLHETYKPKTVKRKIASLKALFHYLMYKELIDFNPFDKIEIKFREPVLLPKTIPLHTIETLLTTMYHQYSNTKTSIQKKHILRDIAVIELLFATGIRISELCHLSPDDFNSYDREILIYGKGSKERKIQIGNNEVFNLLMDYYSEYELEIHKCNHLFINNFGNPLSEQSVRNIIEKYCRLANISLHITPHMFRHSFATFLLEEDVDIRYIQEMLGHSSISVTQIYTHVNMAKQKDILTTKHPRKNITIK
ncbi:MAG: tyrosine-type recombinase/integrase [Lachnospiraceae bacterium]|nr:tyrosine-type recombinase/integrase [Lachnospiraceae bacterium]